jgi:ABC-2 type transport system permease protein
MGSLALFFRLVRASIGGQARYPASSALMLTVGQFLGTGIEVIVVWALFHRFGDVQGWRIGEVALFYGLVNCMFALADALGRGFDVLGTEFLRTGAFDRLLLRPRPLALQLMGNDFRISRAGRLLQGLAVVAFATQQAGIEWTPAAVAIALFALAGGVALFLGILVLQGTLSFWTVESLEIANVLTYGGVQAAQYPLALYAQWFRRVLTFVGAAGLRGLLPRAGDPGQGRSAGGARVGGHRVAGHGLRVPGGCLRGVALGLRRYASTGS